MAGPQTVWGIDVGKCALKAVKLRIGADKSVEAVAADYVEHAKILTQADADPEALWSAALEKFLSRNDISNDKVVVSVPGQQTLARFSKLPPLDKKEMKKKLPDLVRYEADQQIPFDMDEVVWDYQVFEAPDSPDIEVGIFAIKRELIRHHLQHFTDAGIEPASVQAAPLAIYNGMQFDGALDKGAVVLVDIGTENTDLLVATNDDLWTRTINVGGNAFTEALVKSFKLSFNKAETLKRTAASSKYARQIFQAMRPVFADLVQELQRSIGFYSATHRDVDLEQMIGLGSAFKLPGLQKYIQQNLQLEIQRLKTFSKINLPETKEGGSDQAGSFAVAYGLALQGLGQAKVTSTLLPPEIATQVVWRKKRPYFAAAAACLLLAGGVVMFRGSSDKSTLEADKGTSVNVSYDRAPEVIANPPQAPPREFGQTILSAARAFKNKYNELRTQGSEERKKIETVEALLRDRALWPRIVAVVHNTLPAEAKTIRDAENVKAYIAAVKGTPRGEREQVFIDSFTSEYLENVDAPQIADEWMLGDQRPVPAKAGQPRRGFLLTMRCRTPNRLGGTFVVREFANKLQDTGRQPEQGFFFDRIGVVEAKEERSSGGGGRDRSRGGRGQRGWDRDRRGNPPPDSPTRQDESLDPLLGESTAGDRTFEVVVTVVLQDYVPEDQANAQGPGQN